MRAKKSLGQNFLVDRRAVFRIVEAVAPQPADVLIEIGPGRGALTALLAERCGYLLGVEIDPELVSLLSATLPTRNIQIIQADVLTIDWPDTIAAAKARWLDANRDPVRDRAEPRVRVVANLPYYISTPILERLIGQRLEIHDMTLMLQDEVVDRIASAPGCKQYGFLSVLVQLYSKAEKLFKVPPSAFKPAPEVTSAVIRLTCRAEPAVPVDDGARFLDLVKAAFSQRRKTIANNLKAHVAALRPVRLAGEALAMAGIDPARRAETLSLEEFYRLYQSLWLHDSGPIKDGEPG